MDENEHFDDEVVADSEDENEMDMSVYNVGGMGPPTMRVATSISDFSGPIMNKPSSISAFTAGQTSNLSTYTSIAPPNSGKQVRQADSIQTYGTELEDTYIPGTIADRAKTRQRSQKRPSDVIELSSEDDFGDFDKPPLKTKSKPKPTPKVSTKPARESEQPGTSAAAVPRPRPRPRPIPRRVIPDDVTAGLTPPHGPELPIATSLSHYPPSELPPSDLPVSSFSTTYNDLYNRNYNGDSNIPRIETLRNSSALPSSPNSLFDSGDSSSKKQKDVEIDELATPPQRDAFVTSPSKMPPPPTFFAGSSSSSIAGPGRATNAAPAPFPLGLELEPPEPSLMIIEVPTKAASKPKKPRKPKATVDYDDGDFGGKMIVLDEDDMDCDFDPKGDGSAKKKKGKAPAKSAKEKTPKAPKGKKAKANAIADADVPVVAESSSAAAGKLQVEVLLTSKPIVAPKKNIKKSSVNITGDNGGRASSSAFKSREFIADSDDDLDLIGPKLTSDHEPVPTNLESHVASSSSSKPNPSPVPAMLGPDDNDLSSPVPKTSSSSGKRALVAGKKKRKNIVDSDLDDDADKQHHNEAGEDEGGAYVPDGNVSATKKRKVDDTDKKGKRRATVIHSDDDDGDDVTASKGKEKPKAKTPSRGKKTGRKVVQDDDDEEEVLDEPRVPQDRKSTPPERDASSKENDVPPPPKPVYATPKPKSASRPPPTDMGSTTKTPLYSRYEIAPRKSSLPMSELIRRANSIPGSPFSTPHPSTPSGGAGGKSASAKLKPLVGGRTAMAYSPYAKASRSMLSRIAPLHPNRRTPPPPPPPPPPRKKSKKELELEEKWEEEMVDSVGGMEAWAVMDDAERREMRKAKWARELGGWDE